MKLGVLSNPRFTNSFKKLMQLKGLPVETLFALRKVSKQIESALSEYEEVKKKLLDEYGLKDSNGKLIVEEGNVRIEPEKSPEFMSKYSELSLKESEITKLDNSIFGDKLSELSAEDILMLEFIE